MQQKPYFIHFSYSNAFSLHGEDRVILRLDEVDLMYMSKIETKCSVFIKDKLENYSDIKCSIISMNAL